MKSRLSFETVDK